MFDTLLKKKEICFFRCNENKFQADTLKIFNNVVNK